MESTAKKQCIEFGDKEGKCKNSMFNPKRNKYCTNCAGKNFEVQMAKLFLIQRYTVRHNIKISSTQNDFFAELKYGFVTVGILVECKYKFDENETVNGGDVRKFYGSFTIFNQEGKFGKADKALLITNGRFAPEAYEVAKSLNVELRTEIESLENLLDLKPYLQRIVRDYEESLLPAHYIELNVTSGKTLSGAVGRFLAEKNTEALVILGDYGTGKSSFLLKLCADMAKSVLEGRDSTIPLLIQLRDYERSFDLEQLITSVLVNKYHIPNANSDTFLELLNSGYVVLVFDGFDEIASRIDYGIKYKVFNEICRFASINSKVIVSARPNFFNQREEFERIFKATSLHYEPTQRNVFFEELEIAELSKKQVMYYIKTFEADLSSSGFTVGQFVDLIHTVHDLSDLMKRPVLLNVIVATLPHMSDVESTKVNSAVLYERYTGIWLNREDKKGKTLVKASDKLLFSRQLAWKMFTHNKLSIEHGEIPREVKVYFKLHTIEEIDYFSHDIQSCSFLNHDEGHGYKFIHKSFMEYFTALHILTELAKITPSARLKDELVNELFGSSLITMEIGLFIKDLLEVDRFNKVSLLELIRSLDVQKMHVTTQKNMLSIMSKTGTNMTPLLSKFKHLDHLDLSHGVITNGTLKDKNLLGVSFFGSSLRDVRFKGCTLTDSIFRRTYLENVTFDSCNIEASDFSTSVVLNSSFEYTSLANSRFNWTVVKTSNFEGADLTNLEYNDETQFVDCYNTETTFGMPYTLNLVTHR